MKKFFRTLAIILCLGIITPLVVPNIGSETVQAKTKIKLNCTKKTIYKGDIFKLKITGTKKKVKWSSSNKTIATVSSKGVEKGIGEGTAKITAKVGKKKYTCKVNVKGNTISTNFDKLKKHILNYGDTLEDDWKFIGDKWISDTNQEDIYAICYSPSEKAYKFIITTSSSDDDIEDSIIDNYGLTLTIEEKDLKSGDLQFTVEYTNYLSDTIETAAYLSDITNDNNLFWISFDGLDDDLYDSMTEFANTDLDMACLLWEDLLNYNLDMHLSDLGFGVNL